MIIQYLRETRPETPISRFVLSVLGTVFSQVSHTVSSVCHFFSDITTVTSFTTPSSPRLSPRTEVDPWYCEVHLIQ